MATIELAGISLDVWEGGNGPPLLFLHGAGGFRADHPFLGLLGQTPPHHRAVASRLRLVFVAGLDRSGRRTSRMSISACWIVSLPVRST